MQSKSNLFSHHRSLAIILLLFAITGSWFFPVSVKADGVSMDIAASIQAAASDPVLAVLAQYSLAPLDIRLMDQFGYAVAMDGNTVVIGARDADPDLGDGPLPNAGAAYVYTRSGEVWELEAKLVANNADPGDTFGVAVAISGDRIVVGATGVDIESAEDAGAAYVFARQGGGWVQVARLEAADPAEEDGFGGAVDIDGDKIVVGAQTKDLGPLIDSGAAYLFLWSGGKIWSQKASFVPADPEPGDFFGTAVAVDGGTVMVGATEINPFTGRGSGQVFVFTGSGANWTYNGTLRPKDARKGDAFGSSLVLENGTLVVGAPFADPDLGSGRITSAGAVYVFTRQVIGWLEEATLVAEDAAYFDHFGQAVSISGKTILVGAGGKTQAGEDGAGTVYIFRQSQGEWRSQSKTVTDPAYEGDAFGSAVAVFGDWAVVGASGRDYLAKTQSGEAFLIHLGLAQLPDTGFSPNVLTELPKQPQSLRYNPYSELWLELPVMRERILIVGVPRSGNGWDVRWLGNQAGYLEGTAFPTWTGNTGLAAHAVLSNGMPGPFTGLERLAWDDQVVIHAWGQRYIYAVRSNELVPSDRLSVLDPANKDWLTLITCDGYDEQEENYHWRRVVKAVLVRVE